MEQNEESLAALHGPYRAGVTARPDIVALIPACLRSALAPPTGLFGVMWGWLERGEDFWSVENRSNENPQLPKEGDRVNRLFQEYGGRDLRFHVDYGI
jgi:hypothetical protein